MNHSVNSCHYFYSYDTDWTLISIRLSLEMVINMRCAKKLVYCGLVFQLIAFFSDMNVKKKGLPKNYYSLFVVNYDV